MGTIAYKLSEASREKLLERFKPKFEVVRGDHITVLFEVQKTLAMPAPAAPITVIGYASDEGIECLIVSVGGTTERAIGGTYHITLSRKEGRMSKESNEVIAKFGWETLAEPITIEAELEFIE